MSGHGPAGSASIGGFFRADVISPLLFFAAFAALPFAVGGDGQYILTVAARILIIAIAALSLDIILGYGAMVSFGHAAFIGIGAYVMGISSEHGLENIAVVLPLTLVISAAFAWLMGAISVRTTGIQFIMITLAIGQMVYFAATSLARYGGDDGLTLWGRSTLFGARVLDDPVVFYFTVLGTLVVVYLICHILVRARFGRVLRGIQQSDVRMSSLGYPVNRYRTIAFVIAGALCGVSGILLANLTEFVSPAYMTWGRSADLIIILVIGGLARLHGALWGALVLLGLEEAIPYVFEDLIAPLFPTGESASATDQTLHDIAVTIARDWRVVLGPVLILVALYARGGIVSGFKGSGR